ncbi:hypothetical protein EKO27_g1354 [Xylaria grammica]|uniref:Amidoligase enzyme n=1 Tax=Xylaria grammica TaxID=363999 RepID=A0A439DHA8_9PEZI|nr:hypothetical protein EKO27_g1354 [Xylaria grammica]
MTSNQQKETFTVPVGTRLSHGIELELLVAYLYPYEVDPDEQYSADLAPILRVADRGFLATESDVQEHIRTTLRDHGIRVNKKTSIFDDDIPDIPLHLTGLDQWDVDTDPTAMHGFEESRLVRGKAGEYRWIGLELRSPACWDVTDAYDEIRFVVNLIKSRYRVRVNPSCGFHVHVGNGPRYFDAKTLKRAGAFLFAADPMLSRLHAPWRRVGDYSMSIRHRSRLACWDRMQPADAEALVDRAAEEFYQLTNGLSKMNAIPVVPWSDTSMEQAEFMGRIRWEQYAKERVRNGPFMTLNVRPSSPGPGPKPSETSRVAITRSSGPSSPPSSLFIEQADDKDNGDDDDDDDYYGGGNNNAGAFRRRFQDLMETDEFRSRSLKEAGQLPDKLTEEEQYFVLSLMVCKEMFGHSRLEDLSDEEFRLIAIACAPYVEVTRSSYSWNPQANIFNLKDAHIGVGLAHPRPLRLNKLNAENILLNMEAQVDNGEVNVDLSDEGDEGDAEFPLDQIARSTQSVIDDLRAYPSFPERFVPALMREFDAMARAARRNQKYFGVSLQGGDQTTTDAGRASRPPSKSSSRLPTNSRASSPLNVGGNVPSPRGGDDDGFEQVFPRPPSGGAPLPYPTTPSNVPSPRGGDDDGFKLAFPRPSSAGFLPPYPTTPSNDQNLPRSDGESRALSRAPSRLREADNSSSGFDSINLDSNSGSSDGSGSHQSSANELGLRGGFSRPPGTPKNGGDDSSFASSGSSILLSDSSGDFNPPAFQALSSQGDGRPRPSTSGPSSFWVNAGPTGSRNNRAAPKLQPHDFLDLSNSYISRITSKTGLTYQHWDRISWLPYPGGPRDPRDPHPRFSEPEIGDRIEFAPRANYNFKAYGPQTLRGGRRSGEKRTIEFREAGGSLDAEWIVLWTKICVGIMRFCRDAMVSDFITVLEKIVSEEEGQRTDGWEVKYDVCDLLEDICLFTEAAMVRRRERDLGPPK